ncbi:MAG: ATP-binding protein [Gammaproteobacteria bacterium]|nr:ATP-binding protein [Gammaproteobacteria bacterium]
MKLLSMKSRRIECSLHGAQIENGVFDRWFGCQVCSAQAAKLIELEQKEKSKCEDIDRIGLPKLYRNVSFKDWEKTDNRQIEVLKTTLSYAQKLSQTLRVPNLVLSGNSGTGKTHLAACIARYATRKLVRCTYLPSASFMSEIRLSWDFKFRSKHDFEIIEYYGRVPVLIIDELGIGDSVKSQHDLWSFLIDQRYRDLLPTIITTNLTVTELQAQITLQRMHRRFAVQFY